MYAAEERVTKQNYLKEEIIDKNYDAEAFVEFCEADKGADIDLWTLEELKACVKSFTTQVLQRKYSNADTLECKILKNTKLSSGFIKVLTSNPERQSTNIFSPKRICCNVLTLPLGWNVQRKINDFKWLEETLRQEFPGYYIPIIPEVKKKKIDENTLKILETKKMSLFLNYLVSFDVFKRSPSLIYFLEEDREKLRKLKKQKIKKVTEVSNMTTSDGTINCEYDNLQDFTTKTGSFLDSYKEAMKKITKQTKVIKNIIFDLSVSMTAYSNMLLEISNLSSSIPVYGRPIKELYAKLSDSYTKINQRIFESSLNINEYVIGTFKYIQNQGNPLKELYKEKDAAFAESEKVKKNIAKIAAQDKGVNKDLTDKFRSLRERAGVLNYLCRDQTEKFFQYSARVLFEECGEYLNKCNTNITGILTNIAMLQDNIEVSKALI
jgi:PX domain